MNKARTKRPGMTLVELMVVIAIIVILIAMTGPIFKPQLKGRALREAARQFNSYIAVAKAKTAETGRPHGICLIRSGVDANASTKIYVMESPPTYAGSASSGWDSIAQLVNSNPANPGVANTVKFQFPDPMGVAHNSDAFGIIQNNDLIQFNFQGALYRLSGSGGTFNLTPVDPSTNLIPFDPSKPRLPPPGYVRFKVFRQPVKSNFKPLQLPARTTVDLSWSGVGATNAGNLNNQLMVMFTPTGAVDYSMTSPSSDNTHGTIYFLIGRPDQTMTLAEGSKNNLNDPTAIWVSVGDMTGSVTTADNFVVSATPATTPTIPRKLAQEKTNSGGR